MDVINRAEVRKRLLDEGFACIYPPSHKRYFFGHGQYWDIDGNPEAPEGEKIAKTEEVKPTTDPITDWSEGLETEEVVTLEEDLDNRLYAFGKPIEECERQELYTWVENELGMDVHHRTGKVKLLEIIREHAKKASE